MKRTLFGLALVAALVVPMQAQAQVSSTFSVSGSSGSWFLDFAFSNQSPAGQFLYFMGVDLPTGSLSGSPTNFVQCTLGGCGAGSQWNVGGTTYFTNWLTQGYNSGGSTATILAEGIDGGSSLSGFTATSAAANAPTAVDFFAYTYDGQTARLYEGTATGRVASVPEPGSMMLLATGLFGMVGIRRRRQGLTDEV